MMRSRGSFIERLLVRGCDHSRTIYLAPAASEPGGAADMAAGANGSKRDAGARPSAEWLKSCRAPADTRASRGKRNMTTGRATRSKPAHAASGSKMTHRAGTKRTRSAVTLGACLFALSSLVVLT